MTTLPPDGGIAPTDAVGQLLIERTRSLDSARRKAAAQLIDNDGKFCSFVDTMRATQGDRKVRPGDLHLVSYPETPTSDVSSPTRRARICYA